MVKDLKGRDSRKAVRSVLIILDQPIFPNLCVISPSLSDERMRRRGNMPRAVAAPAADKH